MTSGVYQLKFSSGNTYIGKSIDIENRWAQHRDKFIKGKAAKNMQLEYNRYGFPTGSILKVCHADHIDTVEACLINRFQPILNSVRPDDPFLGLQDNEFDKVFNMLDRSTWDHINMIYKFVDIANTTQENSEVVQKFNMELLAKINLLNKQRTEEEIENDTSNKIVGLKESLKEAKCLIESKDNIIAKMNIVLEYHKNRSWWQRLWD